MEKYARLENWNDTSVYIDRATGRIIPETLYFMMAIKGYYNKKEIDTMKAASEGAGKTKHHASDYEREF